MKQLQNRIAESGLTLPVAAFTGVVVWLLSGLLSHSLWIQLGCFALTVYLLVELSNQNALLRVRSRMVSASFIVLTCTACFLLPSLDAGVMQLAFVLAMLMLLQTYQDPTAAGLTFYGFLALGVGSLFFVQTFFYVPLLWLLMATQLQSLSLRTWLASLIGLATPYWLSLLWLVYQQDFQPLLDHFTGLAEAPSNLPQLGEAGLTAFPGAAASPNWGRLEGAATWLFTLVLTIGGIVHFWQRSFEDKIRIRLLYGGFATLAVVSLLLAALFYQHFDVYMRLSFVFASPLIAHAVTFTHSRLSNILFFVVLALAFAITVMNLILMY